MLHNVTCNGAKPAHSFFNRKPRCTLELWVFMILLSHKAAAFCISPVCSLLRYLFYSWNELQINAEIIVDAEMLAVRLKNAATFD